MNCIVIYFSRRGHTKAVATEISRQLNCDTKDIVPAKWYSGFYMRCLIRSYKEKRDGILPPIRGKLNLSLYDTIILGFPVWWGSAPRVIFSFMKSHKIQGRRIIPFCTYKGSAANADKDLTEAFPDNEWRGLFAVKSAKAKRCSKEVEEFIKKHNLKQDG